MEQDLFLISPHKQVSLLSLKNSFFKLKKLKLNIQTMAEQKKNFDGMSDCDNAFFFWRMK